MPASPASATRPSLITNALPVLPLGLAEAEDDAAAAVEPDVVMDALLVAALLVAALLVAALETLPVLIALLPPEDATELIPLDPEAVVDAGRPEAKNDLQIDEANASPVAASGTLTEL